MFTFNISHRVRQCGLRLGVIAAAIATTAAAMNMTGSVNQAPNGTRIVTVATTAFSGGGPTTYNSGCGSELYAAMPVNFGTPLPGQSIMFDSLYNTSAALDIASYNATVQGTYQWNRYFTRVAYTDGTVLQADVYPGINSVNSQFVNDHYELARQGCRVTTLNYSTIYGWDDVTAAFTVVPADNHFEHQKTLTLEAIFRADSDPANPILLKVTVTSMVYDLVNLRALAHAVLWRLGDNLTRDRK
jgi:hypothetical protein